MSDRGEEYDSDYSYDGEDDVNNDNTNEATGPALNVGDIEEAQESDEDEDEEEEGPVAAPAEYEPSFNRGPGEMDAREAGIARNQVSNLQTSIKKRKVREITTEKVARKTVKLMRFVGGNGLANAGYIVNRNNFSQKGCPIGPKKEEARRAIYKEEANEQEALALEIMPKYKVTNNSKRGKNNSPPMDMLKSLQAGFRAELQDMVIGPNRGINMAALGVKFVNAMQDKLQKCKPDGDVVTEEETLAACHLSLLNAFTCNLDEGSAKNFDPVNNDLLYDHSKEMKKRRRFED